MALHKGESVEIFNHKPNGARFKEGVATLVKKLDANDRYSCQGIFEYWEVKFADGDTAQRFVLKEL